MIPNWITHLRDPEDVKRFKQHIYNAKSVLERLTAIMKDKETTLDRSETSIESYESPSWAARQAHKNGYRQCLQELYTLTNLDQKEK